MIFKIRLCIYLCIAVCTAQAQELIDTSYFDSPIKHEIILAGSFGELRTTHFHAGIDIKPSVKNISGDSLFVAAPGYISRIKIQSGGYGRVLYVDHPNGYTTIYAHMDKFEDRIEKYIEHMQISAESYELDIYPKKEKFALPRGAFLGFIGNTGRSYSAHLHFEIRDTQSETPINPSLFGIGSKDTRAPNMTSVSIHGLSPDFQETYFANFKTQKISSTTYTINKGNINIPAWRIGILLEGWDRMNGANNKNGIYKLEMMVDDSLQYRMTVDSVHWDETGFINTHVDYADRSKNKRTAVRCYQMPYNQLSIYDSLGHNGIIPIYANKQRKIKINAIDFEGNRSTLNFGVKRDVNIKNNSPLYEQYIPYTSGKSFHIGSSQITFLPYALDRDLYLSYKEDTSTPLTIYHIHTDTRPLYKNIKVSIPIRGIDPLLMDKLCVVNIQDDGKLKLTSGQAIQDSFLFTTSTLGDFRLHIDTIPPTITKKPIHQSDYYIYEIEDDISDVTVNAYIDGKWIIAPYKVLDNTLKIPLVNLSSGTHILQIIASDAMKNTNKVSDSITIR